MSGPAKIWLLGGTGDVGLHLARLLIAGDGPPAIGRLVLASRNASRNELAARELGADAKLVDFDATSDAAPEMIPAGAIVVNLTEATPPALARAIVDKGGYFIESSATPAYLASLEKMFGAGGFAGLALLYAGVSPGLTNLAAAALQEAAADTAQIDIFVEMGMGRHYGAAATEWFLRTAGLAYPAMIDGQVQNLQSGAVSRQVRFGGDRQPRPALGYGFGDQLHIARRLSLDTVRNFIALDPPWLTRVLGMALNAGQGPRIADNTARLTRWMARMPGMGKTRTRIAAEARRKTGEVTARIDIVTGDQAVATACVLAALVHRISGMSGMSGPERTRWAGQVCDITDVMKLDAALEELVRVLPETTVLVSWETSAGPGGFSRFRPHSGTAPHEAEKTEKTGDTLFWRLVRWGMLAYLGRAARRVLLNREMTDQEGQSRRWLVPDTRRFLDLTRQDGEALRPIARLGDLPNAGNRIMVELTILTIAAYRTLCDMGLARDQARAVVGDIGWNIYAGQLRLASLPFRLTSRDPGKRLQRTIRLLLRFPFAAPGAPGYAVKTWSEGDDIHTHFTHCPPQSFVRRLIAENGDKGELAAFAASWCKYDWPGADIIADDGRRDHYVRRRTLSNGDSVCDMCWKGQANGTAF